MNKRDFIREKAALIAAGIESAETSATWAARQTVKHAIEIAKEIWDATEGDEPQDVYIVSTTGFPCGTCKHEDISSFKEPCISCCHDVPSNWEKRQL